ncbi:PaaI family thioesterase [Corynebacterium breve]|uniref:PaaI family thioesterase n=1 Tax=Corynebacterium breve TaxID=3049799 RepID=A0ABY8VGM8_9CORY|nr:PaaI family thioesterase [Corynebacterium breve]WIM68816.1 PaaI family thioesterase [Corynebacterium breve]
MNLTRLLEAADHPLTSEDLEEINSTSTQFDSFIGTKFSKITPEEVVAQVEVGPHLFQPVGIVNGGAFAAIAESVGSIAGIVAAGAPVVGVTNSTDFFRSVKSGVIVATATPVHLGRTTQLWRIEMLNDDRLVATSSLRTMVMRD